MTYPCGNVYEGNFDNYTFKGYGEMTYKNGNKYQGQWTDHHFAKEGGVFTLADGRSFKGTIENE